MAIMPECWHLHHLGALCLVSHMAVGTMTAHVRTVQTLIRLGNGAHPSCRQLASPQGFTSALLGIAAAFIDIFEW